MTTGSYSFGGYNRIGSFASKSWSGANSIPTRERGWPTSALLDVDGNPLDLRYASKDEVSAAHVRRKGLAIKRGHERTRVKSSKRTDNPYTCDWRKGVNAPVTHESGSTYPFEVIFGGFGGVDAWSANDDLKLVSELKDSIQGSDFNAGVFLAEAPQAVRLIADSAFRIGKAMEFTRKGNFKAALNTLWQGRQAHHTSGRQFATSGANLHLELQYGWKPLVNDMESAAHFLAWSQYVQRLKVVRVSRKVNTMPTSASPSLWKADASSYGFTRKTIIARISEVDRVRLSGLTDVASIAWEKLPWSFVADWVIPIGNYLEAANINRSIKATYVTTTVKRFYGKPDRDVILSGGTWRGASRYWCTWGSMNRSVSSSLNIPLPRVKPWNKIASVPHALNALALLTQQASKLRGTRHDVYTE